MIKLCIFDLDGTVLDTLQTIAYYGNYALEKNGIAPIPVEEYKLLVGKGAVNLVKNMLNYRGCYSEALFQKVFPVYDAAYNANTSYKTEVYPGVREMLDGIKALGIQIAILSNKPHFATCGVINAIMGEGYFHRVYGQREGIPLKPDPTSVCDLMAELNAKPEECLYIGDTGTDMKTGKNAGIFTVGVLWGFRGEEELRQTGADLIAAHPSQILEHITRQKG